MTEVHTQKASQAAEPGSPVNAAPPPLGMADQLHLQRAQKKTNTLLWGILVLLLLLVGTVIFVLPDYVNRATPSVSTVAVAAPTSTAAPQGPAISPFEEAQRLRQREAAQNTLAALLELQAALEQKQVLDWPETPFNEALALARSGDEAYATQRFTEANDLYQSALTLLQQISASEASVFAGFMAQAAAAYQAGDAETADRAYGQALLIDPDSSEAVAGMERSRVLDAVLELFRNGRNLQASNQLEAARDLYQQALAIDSSHAETAAALAEVNGAIVERNFATAMSRGYAALESGDPEQAQTAFQQALAIKPGAAEVDSAMQQARDQQTFSAISVHLTTAQQQEAGENWQAAVAAWDQALAIDPNLVSAQEGRRRSDSRNNLDMFLTTTINDPLRLAEESVHAQTTQVLSDAQRIADPGPKLLGQLQQVHDILERIHIPVNVQLQSDGLTAVTLYRVQELGQFTSQTLSLMPGNYTAVGVRPGYRDVRVEFVVAIGGQIPEVTIACNEAI